MVLINDGCLSILWYKNTMIHLHSDENLLRKFATLMGMCMLSPLTTITVFRVSQMCLLN